MDDNDSENKDKEYHAQYNGNKLIHLEGLTHMDSVQVYLDSSIVSTKWSVALNWLNFSINRGNENRPVPGLGENFFNKYWYWFFALYWTF